MDTEQQPLFPSGAIRLLTSGFDISPEDVTADARQVLEWRRENDDLLVSIEQRHQWTAKQTTFYLRSLLFVLGRRPEQIDQLPNS